jgi:hypothetical protein
VLNSLLSPSDLVAPSADPSNGAQRARRRAGVAGAAVLAAVVCGSLLPAAASADSATTVSAAAAPAAVAPLSRAIVIHKQRIPIAFRTMRRADPSLRRGTTRVVRAGRVGVLVKAWAVPVPGSTVKKHLLAAHTGRLPVTRVVAVGTRSALRARTSVGSTGGLNWAGLARCESGGNPRAVSGGGTYRGLYQFDFGTWRSVGGSGDPAAASPAEQTARAYALYQRSGRGPWPVCGRNL